MIRSYKPSGRFSPGAFLAGSCCPACKENDAVLTLQQVAVDEKGGESKKNLFNALVPFDALRSLTIQTTVDAALAEPGAHEDPQNPDTDSPQAS